MPVYSARVPDRPRSSDDSVAEPGQAGTGLAGSDEPVSGRFGFGANWRKFLSGLDEERIEEAQVSLQEMLDVDRLDGKSLLDAGSGSGLFSLAAVRLGAARVHSFDYDPESVACTMDLRSRFYPDASNWTVERGDVLDARSLADLGSFDIVYSWGVLHHTGDMWQAIENACSAVSEGGTLFIAIYNDQGLTSQAWMRVKRAYSTGPSFLRPLILLFAGGWESLKSLVVHLFRGDLGSWFRYWSRTGGRGMGGWRDLIDWVGGYPFEVARPDQIFHFCTERGFTLRKLRTTTSGAVNEYVFERTGK